MSNNPGKKGKPAPWERRAAEHREQALQEYRLANHPAYAAWSTRRSEAFRVFRQETGADDLSNRDLFKAMKAANTRLRAWDKTNPSPMSWDDHKRLETEFAARNTWQGITRRAHNGQATTDKDLRNESSDRPI